MKTETFQKENGRFSWRIIDGETVIDSPKSFPNEDAAQRNLLRTLRDRSGKKPANPIPTARMKAKPE